MDVRFFWLRDRIKKIQFAVKHLPGYWNISDFFTKSLPRDKFVQFYCSIGVNLDDEKTIHNTTTEKKEQL
jgi:hypothetical protein